VEAKILKPIWLQGLNICICAVSHNIPTSQTQTHTQTQNL